MRLCVYNYTYDHGYLRDQGRTMHTNMKALGLGERLKSESKTGTGIADAVADAEAAQKMDEADEDED